MLNYQRVYAFFGHQFLPIPWSPPGRVEGRHVIVRDVLVEVPTAMDDASETQGLAAGR